MSNHQTRVRLNSQTKQSESKSLQSPEGSNAPALQTSMTSVDFAAAQQRIAARRAQNASSIGSSSLPSIGSGALSNLPAPIAKPLVSLQRHLSALIGHGSFHFPAFRSGQLDAELLDEELLSLFTGQVGEALKYYGSSLREDWVREIQLLLRAALWKVGVWDKDGSYGVILQGLRFVDARRKSNVSSINGRSSTTFPASTPFAPPTKWQKATHGLISVGGRYAWSKWEERCLRAVEGSHTYSYGSHNHEEQEQPSALMLRLARWSSLASSAHSAAALVSFVVFLANGKYRTLLDRILRLRLVPSATGVSREVSFEYLNRQLIWHAFTEFLLFLLPLVGISRWRRWIARAWRKIKVWYRKIKEGDNGQDEADNSGQQGELAHLPERTCAICYGEQHLPGVKTGAEGETAAIAGAFSGIMGSAATDITNPYEAMPCGCVYCFVCLAERLEAEDGDGWTCLRCGGVVRECRPWRGDVLVEGEEEDKHREHRGLDASAEATGEKHDVKVIGDFQLRESDEWNREREDTTVVS
ncbi:MAG: peroxisome assembly protein (Peroxin-2) [Alyxoria varia]|nr:MAG: peroxisome assembly protein (Peroxin-2) [Alyxoria varia]